MLKVLLYLDLLLLGSTCIDLSAGNRHLELSLSGIILLTCCIVQMFGVVTDICEAEQVLSSLLDQLANE